jgi:hypothetical protein
LFKERRKKWMKESHRSEEVKLDRLRQEKGDERKR